MNSLFNPHDFQNPGDMPRTGGIPINRIAPHLHLIYILDISGSMDGYKIKALVNCLNKTLYELRKRADVSGAVDISVITFNENGALLQPVAPLSEVGDFTVDEFTCEGGTNGWSGLTLALQQYEERRDEYHRYGYQHYPSVIVYMSDGLNNVGSDDGIVARLLAYQKPQGSRNLPKVNFIPIGFGADADLDFLRSLNIKGETAEAYNMDDLDFIFEYVGSSCIYLSSSSDPANPAAVAVPTKDRVDAMKAFLAKQIFATA